MSAVQQDFSLKRPQAERLIRTETSQAYGAAQHRSIADVAKKNPQAKLTKQWVHQSSYKCEVCIDLDGTERPMDGVWIVKIGKKSKRVAHPPAHPNCTCRIVAMSDKMRDKLEKLGY